MLFYNLIGDPHKINRNFIADQHLYFLYRKVYQFAIKSHKIFTENTTRLGFFCPNI